MVVLLTAKFLDPGSASTAALQRSVEGKERILLIHSRLQWACGERFFDFSEASSELIKNCLSNNEALAFRPRDDSFGIRGECNSSASEGVSHEWRAMADRLASLLGRSLVSSRASAPTVSTELLSDVHERLADALRRLALNEAGSDGSNSRGKALLLLLQQRRWPEFELSKRKIGTESPSGFIGGRVSDEVDWVRGVELSFCGLRSARLRMRLWSTWI